MLRLQQWNGNTFAAGDIWLHHAIDGAFLPALQSCSVLRGPTLLPSAALVFRSYMLDMRRLPRSCGVPTSFHNRVLRLVFVIFFADQTEDNHVHYMSLSLLMFWQMCPRLLEAPASNSSSSSSTTTTNNNNNNHNNNNKKRRGDESQPRAPKRPLTIPYELDWKPKPSAAPLEDFLLALQPFAPPSSVSLLIPLQNYLVPNRNGCCSPLNSEVSFVFFQPFSCRSSTFLRFPPP